MHKSLILVLSSILGAAEVAAPNAPQDQAGNPPAPPPSSWTWKTRLGAYLSNAASYNAEDSRDPAIAGSIDSTSYRLSGTGSLVWNDGPHRVEQSLDAAYGSIRTDTDRKWKENTDSIAYAITYEHSLGEPQFLYANGAAVSVFTGKEPDREPVEPIIAKGSAGYGHRYANLLPETDALIGRIGVYARKRWESGAKDYQTDLKVGPEALLRYERKQSADVSYHIQAEAYSEFDDIHHITTIAEAGLTVRISQLLTFEAKARAYHESRPKEAAEDDPGYDTWSLRQEALLGLVWESR